ncbi:MAG: hypothetical protein A2W85_00925 [Bacteroidetes bacterium GWF2_41_31]|nr:MAG: hypothetical protein A2W85_00925 [Bacteroidetes bacterium GWF2_41_31]
MKTLLLIVSVLLGYYAMAQDLNLSVYDHHNNLLNINNLREDIVLNDSIYKYELNSSSWLLDSKDYLYYNDNGKITERSFYSINDQYEWELKRKFFYIYDDVGHWIEFLDQKINPYTLEFENYSYHYHFFNGNDLLVKDTVLVWDNIAENWVNDMAGILSYNNEEQLTSISWNDWDSDLMVWKQSSLQLYNYNTNLELSEYIFQTWDTTSNSWTNYSRRTYTYNENGNLKGELWSNWNNLDTSWVNFRIHYNEYDSSYFLINTISDNWLANENKWIHGSREIIANDEHGNIENILIQEWVDNDSVWYDVYNHEYYNSMHQTPSTVIDTETPIIELYPNPTKDIIYITNKSDNEYYIELINTSGKIMCKRELDSNQEVIDLSNMNCGLYYLSFYLNGERKFTRKLVKK